jgi:hypothetical protein
MTLIFCAFLNVIPCATRSLYYEYSHSDVCNHAVKSRTTDTFHVTETPDTEKEAASKGAIFFAVYFLVQLKCGCQSSAVTVCILFERRASAVFSDRLQTTCGAHPVPFRIVCGVTSRILQLSFFLLLIFTARRLIE